MSEETPEEVVEENEPVESGEEDLAAAPVEGEETVENAAPSGEGGPAATTEVEPRTFMVKVDGEEIEVSEDEILRDYQLRTASDRRFNEAASMRQQAEELIKLLKTNPRGALEHPAVGVNLKDLAEEILSEHLEEELLDPQEKEIKKLQRQLKQIETDKKLAQETEASKEREALEIKYAEEYEKQISDALETGGLPKTNRTVDRMVYYMREAINKGYELKASDVVSLVREDYITDIKDLLGASDAKVIADMLGEGGLKKIRKYDVDRVKNPKGATPTASEQAPEKQREGKTRQKISMDEFFDKLRNDS
jgi:hypothetical protein